MSKFVYTDEMVDFLRDSYAEHGSEGIENVVSEFNEKFDADRNVRMIRGKLGTLPEDEADPTGPRLYKPLPKVEKPKVDKGPTKADIIGQITDAAGDAVEGVDLQKALAGATKDGLNVVLALISGDEDESEAA